MSILNYIEKMKEMYEGPRITAQGPRTLLAEYKPGDDKMEQTEVLRPKRIDIFGNVIPAETLETWEPNPFLKPHAEGGRIGYEKGLSARGEDIYSKSGPGQEWKKIKYGTVEGQENIKFRDLKHSKTGEIKRVYDVQFIKSPTKRKKPMKTRTTGTGRYEVLTKDPKYRNIEKLEDAIKFRDNFRIKNPLIQKSTKELYEKLNKLWKDSRIKNIFNKGKPGEKEIAIVQEILGGTERQAQEKLSQLADALSPSGAYKVAGIKKIDPFKADAFYDFHKTKDVAKGIEDIKLARSVGEKTSLGTMRGSIQEMLPFTGGEKTYSVDEVLGRGSSYRLGSKPYAIFGQVIAGNLNQKQKMEWDAVKSLAEEKVQKAIKSGKKIKIKEAVDEFNAKATKYEKQFNAYKSRGFKKVTLPRISLGPPSQTIKNKPAYNKYKKYFDKNFKKLKYSFVIPKDIKPLPDIAAGLKDKTSSTYRTFIRDVRKAASNFIDNVEKYDEKELFRKIEKLLPKQFKQFRKMIPRFVSTDDISEKRYASADNIMTSGIQYVDDKNWFEKNPWTTGAGATGLTATTLAGSKTIPTDPLKKIRQKIKSGLGKTFRTLGTPLAGPLWAAWTASENLKSGKSLTESVVNPWVGLELSLPAMFKENVSKITKSPALQKALTLGKFGTKWMPGIGWGITGISALRGMPEEPSYIREAKQRQKAREEDYTRGEHYASGGLTRTVAPDSGPMSQGLRSLYINDKDY